jgi:tRNA dimethylallyltransferase
MELALLLPGEILSVDSMQVYRGMDIGTAKPRAEDRTRVRHHLLDVARVSEPFDAARFVRLASAALDEIHARGATPILCGGTGLYFKALLEGLGEAPPSDPALRATLAATPLEVLLAELAERDPVTHAAIDRQNPRRVIRAVEVIRLTGRPFSEQRSPWGSGSAGADDTRTPVFYLERKVEDLHGRIQERVRQMFAQGWVEETRRLLEAGIESNPTALQAIGYRQILSHLRGQQSLEATIGEVTVRTRQYARRQGIWFRRHARVIAVSVLPTEPATQTAARIAREFARLREPAAGGGGASGG